MWNQERQQKYGKVKTKTHKGYNWVFHEETQSYYDPINDRLVDNTSSKFHDYSKLKTPEYSNHHKSHDNLANLLAMYIDHHMEIVVHQLKAKSQVELEHERLIELSNGESLKFFTLKNLSEEWFEAEYARYVEYLGPDALKNGKNISHYPYSYDAIVAVFTLIKYESHLAQSRKFAILNEIEKFEELKRLNPKITGNYKISFVDQMALDGFCHCQMEKFIKMAGYRAPMIIDFLVWADIIEQDHRWNHESGFGDKFSKHRRINPKYVERGNTYKQVEIKDKHIINNFLAEKIEARRLTEHSFSHKEYLGAIADVKILMQNLDFGRITKYTNGSTKAQMEFYKAKNKAELTAKIKNASGRTIEDWCDYLQGIVDHGLYYFNVDDKFGHRFHSVFTNIKSYIREFVSFNGIPYETVDIRNSQMIISAVILTRPDIAKKLLVSDDVYDINGVEMDLFQCFQYLMEAEGVDPNLLQSFYDDALAGNVYRKIAEKGNISDDEAKPLMFQGYFSASNQNYDAKKSIFSVYPELKKVINALNNPAFKERMLPKIAQVAESNLFIKTIVKDFYAVKQNPAFTVHDSITMHPADAPLFWEAYNNVFNKMGLSPFKTKISKCKKLGKVFVLSFNKQKLINDRLLYLKNPALYAKMKEKRKKLAEEYRSGKKKSPAYIKVKDRGLFMIQTKMTGVMNFKTTNHHEFYKPH